MLALYGGDGVDDAVTRGATLGRASSSSSVPATSVSGLRLPMVYSYAWGGRRYRGYVFLRSRQWLKRFERTSRPRVVVDPENQRRSLLADLFS